MIQFNVSLQPYNTFGIDVSATAFAPFSSVPELEAVLLENNRKLPLFILGGGSNVLFTKPVDALVLKNELKGFEHLNETGETIDIRVGAGEEWHTFVRYCVEIKDCFVELTAFHIEKRELHTFSAEDCAFGYRESVFKRDLKGQYIIVSVTYRLQKHPQFNTAYGAIQTELEAMNVTELSVSAISQAVMNIRNSKLPNPKELGNAGSFFKNPVVHPAFAAALKERFPEIPNYPQPDGSVKLAAGWLIEQAGWKGKRIGNCGVHVRQALVLVNYGGATGDEIYALSQAVLDDVQQQFGVLLEREVNIL